MLRYVFSNGTIIRIAGNGTASYFGDRGPGIRATLSSPNSVWPDGLGGVFIAEACFQVVLGAPSPPVRHAYFSYCFHRLEITSFGTSHPMVRSARTRGTVLRHGRTATHQPLRPLGHLSV